MAQLWLDKVWLAIFCLSAGWSMHAALAARICFRCLARKSALKFAWTLATFGRRYERIARYAMIAGIAIAEFTLLVELSHAVGSKKIFAIIQEIAKNRSKPKYGGIETKVVPRS